MRMRTWIGAATLVGALVATVCGQLMPGDPAEAHMRRLTEIREMFNPEKVSSAAAGTSDAETLLGLALLVDNSHARDAIAERALQADAALAPLAAMVKESSRWQVLFARSAEVCLSADPTNALGYYLQANELLRTGDVLGAVIALRQGAACERLDTYDEKFVKCVRAGIGALKLQGAGRFKALETAATQGPPLWACLAELPEKTARAMTRLPLAERAPASEYLLSMAGQIRSMPKSHAAAKAALHAALSKAYLIRADAAAAAGRVSEERGYRNTIEIIDAYDWGVGDIQMQRFAESAADLALSGGGTVTLTELLALDPRLADEAKAAIIAAIAEQERAAQRLIDKVNRDFDYIVENVFATGMPLTFSSGEWRDVAEAERELVYAHAAVTKTVNEKAPRYQNIRRLLQVGLGIGMYQMDYAEALPPSTDELVEKGYLKAPWMPRSAATNDAFAYRGAVDGLGSNDPSLPKSIVAYDPPVEGSDIYIVLWGDLHVSRMSRADFENQLKKQAKE